MDTDIDVSFEQKALDFAAFVEDLLLGAQRHGSMPEHLLERALFLANDLRTSLIPDID